MSMEVTVDPWGRVTLNADDLVDLIYAGGDIRTVMVTPGQEVERFNAMCRERDLLDYVLQTPAPLDVSPEEELRRRADHWFIGDDLADVDLRAFLVDLCSTEEARIRVNDEMDLYEARGLLPLLRTMIVLVDHFRKTGAVWGVGRGSSVASYVLFLIGVHKIDSMKYNLDIRDFLRN